MAAEKAADSEGDGEGTSQGGYHAEGGITMIGVTEAGLSELKKMLDEHTDNPQAGLRLTADQSGTLGLVIDVETAEDQVLEHEGSTLLIIEQNLRNVKGWAIILSGRIFIEECRNGSSTNDKIFRKRYPVSAPDG
jgi:hypothetical protein